MAFCDFRAMLEGKIDFCGAFLLFLEVDSLAEGIMYIQPGVISE